MRIFLYELITGGGMLGQIAAPPASLLAEGRAMIEALSTDFSLLPGVEVHVLRDDRLPVFFVPGIHVHEVGNSKEELAIFEKLAADSDWTLLIAPETDGLLEQRARIVLQCGGRLLGPSPETIALCADKQRMAEHLAAAGIKVPHGIRIEPGSDLPADFPYPAVVKPIDGCGSQGIVRVNSFAERPPRTDYERRLEEAFLRGPQHTWLSLSVSVLVGAGSTIELPPCGQAISEDGRFVYSGGFTLPEMSEGIMSKSRVLRAIESIPQTLGYFGVDMLWGGTPLEIVVVEINPRLTTSYVGLRRAVNENLAGLLLDVASGNSPAAPRIARAVRFTPDGKVYPLASSDFPNGDPTVD